MYGIVIIVMLVLIIVLIKRQSTTQKTIVLVPIPPGIGKQLNNGDTSGDTSGNDNTSLNEIAVSPADRSQPAPPKSNFIIDRWGSDLSHPYHDDRGRAFTNFAQ